MIDSIKIQNFKSIVNLELPLGRFNVIIGPNGCGKSNILEAISMASAASQDKLDNEYLINRDVRVSDAKFMVNAFEDNEEEESDIASSSVDVISIQVKAPSSSFLCQLRYEESSKKWINYSSILAKWLSTLFSYSELDYKTSRMVIDSILAKWLSPLFSYSESDDETLRMVIESLKTNLGEKNIKFDDFKELLNRLANPSPELASFLTYRPSEHFLRKTFESSLFPLGVHGEGLLKYLKEIAEEDKVDLFDEINNGLSLLDWFDGFNIPDNLLTNEYRLTIGDRYLKDSLHFFDQISTNEGFLFLLFYLTLFNSKDTPRFFAVDNIESALNPKLMTRLTEYLVERTIVNDKQVIVTTHSPFVLDSLDLGNDDIRLFVARRDIDGHTRIERVPYRADRTMKLSQLWMSGLIGGLPDNF